MSRILVTKEIADRLKCSDKTVSRMFKNGKLNGAFKLGRNTSSIRITEDNLSKVISLMEKKGGEQNG